MNSKEIGYEEAKKRLYLLEKAQKFIKKLRSDTVEGNRVKQENLYNRKKEINYLLSIVASEKRARYLYWQLNNITGTYSIKSGKDD